MFPPMSPSRPQRLIAAALIACAAALPASPILAATASPTCKYMETACELEAQRWQTYISKSSALAGNPSAYPTVSQCQIIYGQAVSRSAWPASSPLLPDAPCTP